MTKRGDGKGASYDRDPNGWYVEERSTVTQLMDAISFAEDGEPCLIWDPCCGGGNILDVAKARGHEIVGSDIIDRPKWTPSTFLGGRFYRSNILQATKWPTSAGRSLSIICNPPYNEPFAGIGAAIIHRILNMVPFYRAAFIMPIEFLTGQTRYDELWSKHRPSHVGIYCERPDMPPGELLARLGEDARGGGMQDYCVVVWTDGGPYRTELIFLKPSRVDGSPKLPRRKRADRTARADRASIGKRVIHGTA